MKLRLKSSLFALLVRDPIPTIDNRETQHISIRMRVLIAMRESLPQHFNKVSVSRTGYSNRSTPSGWQGLIYLQDSM